MHFELTTQDYLDYIECIKKTIAENKEYVSGLDAATGDGDHWVNINMGFEKLIEHKSDLLALDIASLFKQIGTLMMSTIGGASGVLYGSAYLGGAKALKGQLVLDDSNLCAVLSGMCTAIMERGQSAPGYKTMVDAIYPAVEAYKQGLAAGMDTQTLLKKVRRASIDGAAATKDMEAVRGRAYYQANKGVGHVDPGAVTMSYQISGLMDFILKNKF